MTKQISASFDAYMLLPLAQYNSMEKSQHGKV